MVWLWLVKPVLAVAAWVVDALPVAHVEAIVAAVAPAGRIVGMVSAMNEVLPVTELLAALGVLAGVYVALYGVMLVRRTFSLFWPGAGS